MAPARAVITVRGRPSALESARASVKAVLAEWGLAHSTDDAQLIATELLANAIEHAPDRETYELELTQLERGFRLSLADTSSRRPVVAPLDHDRPRGRGMRLIEALAAAWGTEEYAGGKRVWVELASEDCLHG